MVWQANQSNAWLQRQLPTKFSIDVATVYQGSTAQQDSLTSQ